jgi:Tol biopolymer transport system component/DNA-binding winged helix-turn-helix (wHTH) protein
MFFLTQAVIAAKNAAPLSAHHRRGGPCWPFAMVAFNSTERIYPSLFFGAIKTLLNRTPNDLHPQVFDFRSFRPWNSAHPTAYFRNLREYNGTTVKASARVLRFGPHEIDLKSYELRRAGHRLPISKIPLDLLIFLVERRLVEGRGTLVTREEIVAQLWSKPEVVDTERGINNAINRIRGLLNDDPNQPRYIETAVGRGYRFIGAVEEIAGPEASPAVKPPSELPELATAGVTETAPNSFVARPAPVATGRASGIRNRMWAWGIVATCLLAAAVGFWFIGQSAAHVPPKLEATQITTNESENLVMAGAISPSGALVAYADPDGLFLRGVKTGVVHQLKGPTGLWVDRIAWFPDDLHLLVSGFGAGASKSQVWTASIDGGAASLIREDAEKATPSPDGNFLAFTMRDGSEIWVSGAQGGQPRLFLKGGPGERFPFVFWAAGGKRLSYQRQVFAPNSSKGGSDSEANYISEYGSRDFSSGKELATAKNIRFESACAVSGDRVIYMHTAPWSDTGRLGIWEVQTDEATGAFLSAPRQLTALGDASYGLTASGDGREIAAIWERGQPDVYLADLDRPGPVLANVRRMTSDSKNDFPHAWTQDSQSVIFESNREGDYHLFRQRLDQHTPEKLTEMQGQQVLAQLSPDGSWLMFIVLKGWLPSSVDMLYRAGLDGRKPVEIPLDRPLDEFRCPILDTGSCVLRETLEHKEYVYYALDPVKGRGRELARTAWMPKVYGDWAVSPDGTTAALPNHQPNAPGIRLVPLDAASSSRHETEIRVKGIALLWGINWAADGAGWFAASKRGDISALIYIDSTGESRVLRETTYSTWGVPSPDGRKLAYVDYTADRNVWVWK